MSMTHSPDPSGAAAQSAELTGRERRREERKPVDWLGIVYFEPGDQSCDCEIRNISQGGARIRVPGTVQLPRQVKLQIVHRSLFREALIAWRLGDDAGLQFIG